MNKTVLRTLLVCIAIPLVFFLISIASSSYRSDFIPELGLSFAAAALLYLIPGIILMLIKDSRQVGKGVLLSVGLLLLVGFSLCSIQPISFH